MSYWQRMGMSLQFPKLGYSQQILPIATILTSYPVNNLYEPINIIPELRSFILFNRPFGDGRLSIIMVVYRVIGKGFSKIMLRTGAPYQI
jgi:hypothetical protein